MTTIAHICERWAMKLESSTGDKWFLDWVLRSPKEVSSHLTAGWCAYSSLLTIYDPLELTSAVEYFGGMGAQALMIENLFRPTEHTISDYSAEAVEHVREFLPRARAALPGGGSPGWAVIKQADAYDPATVIKADLVGLDFGDLTAWRTRDGEKHRQLLDRVFELEPKAVVLTDIAGPRLALQRQRYEELLGPGTCVSYESYLNALVARLSGLYGYSLVAGFTHRWSTVMAFAPGDASWGEIVPVPTSPVGLELF